MKCRECNKTLSNQGYIHLNGTHDYYCYNCMPSMQPERSKREDFIFRERRFPNLTDNLTQEQMKEAFDTSYKDAVL